jgi:hypothetical protein
VKDDDALLGSAHVLNLLYESKLSGRGYHTVYPRDSCSKTVWKEKRGKEKERKRNTDPSQPSNLLRLHQTRPPLLGAHAHIPQQLLPTLRRSPRMLLWHTSVLLHE